MERHGLLEQGWSYQLDNYSKQFGVCCENRRLISVSKKLAAINPPNETRNTILHEIAHALVGCWHWHDEVWVSCFLRIGGDGKEFGYGNLRGDGVFYLPYIP